MLHKIRKYKLAVIAVFSTLFIVLILHYLTTYHFYREIIQNLNGQISNQQIFDADLEINCAKNDTLDKSYHELSFINAQLQVAGNTPSGLLINIVDSTVSIQMKGVKVFSTKITHYQLDFILKDIGINGYRYFYENPLKIVDEQSNIEKEPIIHIVAPTDTAAARQAPKHQPDTTLIKTVHVSYLLEKNIVLTLEGMQNPGISLWVADQWHFIQNRLKLTQQIIKNLFSKSDPDYQHILKLVMNNRDAQIIYRALQADSQVCIMY